MQPKFTMKKYNNVAQVLFSGLTVSLFVLITSCKANEIHPLVNIPNEFVNQQINIRVAGYSNTYKNTDPVSLELKYNSNDVIVFPNNYNLKIFELSNGNWVEIQEKPTERLPQDDIVLAPNKTLPAVHVVVLFPNIVDMNKTHKLRIYVIGEMQTDDGNQNVAAYTDITLGP